MRRIEFKNTCGCIVDEDLLSRAIHNAFPHFKKNKSRKFLIYTEDGGRRAKIWIEGQAHILCRLIIQYVYPIILDKDIIVHHLDNQPLNNIIENLQIVSRSEHTRIHRKGYRAFPHNSEKHNIIALYKEGYTLTQVAKNFNCSTCTIERRLEEWGIPRRLRGAQGIHE